MDRNFDDIAQHFFNKVHSTHKGELRRRVIQQDLTLLEMWLQQPRRVADIGAGFGDFCRRFAREGHQVWYNDLSKEMMLQAQRQFNPDVQFKPGSPLKIDSQFKSNDLTNLNSENTNSALPFQIEWSNQPYQEFLPSLEQSVDLILCHAVIEWLEQPERLIPTIASKLVEGGYLSLCFYNTVGRDFRNLICGNFHHLDHQSERKSDQGSLTPNTAPTWTQIAEWLEQHHFSIEKVSGIRVFSDYATQKRGGLLFPEQVIERELQYSQQEPFKWLGRYIHVLAKKVS